MVEITSESAPTLKRAGLSRATEIIGQLDIWPILLSALAVRAIWMTFLTGTIDTEGAEYARIAQNLLSGRGYSGIATPGTELMFPPLFPLLIAGLSLLTHNAEVAGRLVSVTMGTLLVLPVFSLTASIYGRRTAYIAAALTAFHPLLVNLSATVYCETTYMALVLAGLSWSERCLGGESWKSSALAGLFFGLAYLTRPEAILYPFLVVLLLLGYNWIQNRRGMRRAALRSCLLIAVSLALAVPYIVWLSHETGQFRIEGKSAINNAMGQGLLSGIDDSDLQYGIDQDLKKRGIWLTSNIEVLRSNPFSLIGLVHFAAAELKTNLPVLAQQLSGGGFFGSPILFGLLTLGLFRRPWTRAVIARQLLLFMALGVAGSSLLSIYRIDYRFFFVFLPIMIVWAAEGLVAVGQWAAATLQVAWRSGLNSKRVETTAQLAASLALLMVALIGINHVLVLKFFDQHSRPIKFAGEWLDRFQPGPKTVMDNWTVLAFHAGATYMHFPHTDASSALRYIDQNNVDFLVLEDRSLPGWPYLQDWIDNGIPDRRAQLIYSSNRPPLGRLVIYKWGHGASKAGSGSLSPAGADQPSYSQTASVDPNSAKGPLRVSSANPRYFENGAGRAIYLTGAHTWSSFQDASRLEPLESFDYAGYLNFLTAHNLNFIRLYVWEQADWAPWRPYHYRLLPSPYLRPGPGLARDGKPKMDLTKYDPSYFDRLRSRVTQAGTRGIYVSVMLFNGFSVERKGLDGENPWLGHPYYRENNINGVDGDPQNRGDGTAVHTLENATVTHYQEEYVRKIIDTVDDLDNVLFEICNECSADSIEWQYHMIKYIKEYEATKPKQHPVGMTAVWPGGKNRELFDSPADWISPNGAGGYDGDPPAADGTKVILADTDHLWGIGGDRQWAWKSFLRGLNPIFMDPYDNQWMYPPQPSSSEDQGEDVRVNMGYTLSYARRIDLSAMKPRADLASSGFCLANPTGSHPAFLVYMPSGGTATVNLTGIPGEMSVEWLDPKSGRKQNGGTVAGGGEQLLAAPFGGDAVLYIFRR